MKLRAIKNHILVADMAFNERLSTGGIVILGDDQTSKGIRPRWARVIAVGNDEKTVKVDQYVMVKHGRWTRGVKHEDMVIRRVDNEDILCVSDVKMIDESEAGDEVVTDQGKRELPA